MSTPKHTPGPLTTDARDRRPIPDMPTDGQQIRGTGHTLLAEVYPDEQYPGRMEADAVRLVACWNACGEVPTTALAPGIVAKLLTACKFALAAIMTNDPIAAADHLRQTIAKVESK